MASRTKRLEIRVSQDELDAICERTKRAGLLTRDGEPIVSDYVRRSALGHGAAANLRPVYGALHCIVSASDGIEGERREQIRAALAEAFETLDGLSDRTRV
ncbi:hypothetical protein [Olsenella sp. Marseille-P4559]|uniref:plasmid mobilization protein n=1 Tax=Olsenella sp. Marseille-P4559 TaxID=2364795 RepID=UPI001031570B|nr:hypothetical protein [Olsenella sp. Marseille-P4559]